MGLSTKQMIRDAQRGSIRQDRHFFLVADGHVYKRVDVPNSKPRRWHLVEMEWESALHLMIHDCERLAALS